MTERRWWIVVLFAASLLASSAAEAQRVAVSYSPALFTAVTEVVNLATGVVESSEPRLANGTPVFTSDGRFLLLRTTPLPATTPILEIRDLATGLRTSTNTPFVPLRAHPRRLAVYGLGPGGGLGRLDSTGLRTYSSCNGLSPIQVELTLDGSRLLVLCQSGDIESIDEATGLRLGLVAAGTTAWSGGFAINADGTQALVARGVAGAGTELVLFDLATGTEIISTPMPGPPPPAPYSGPGFGRIVGFTPSRDAVVVTNAWVFPQGPVTYHYRTQILDFATLAPRRELAVRYDLQWMAISPDGERAFVGSIHASGFGVLQDLDLRTGQQTVSQGVGTMFALGAAFAPLAPTLQPAELNGQRVTLSWSLAVHSPAAQRFVIHAGSRSGASDLGTIDVGGDVTSFSVTAVPPGRYFVRVTATNVTGTSSPSNEVVIDIPAAGVH